MAEFRRCGFTDAEPGSAARLKDSVEGLAMTHELSVARVRAWLKKNGKGPRLSRRRRCGCGSIGATVSDGSAPGNRSRAGYVPPEMRLTAGSSMEGILNSATFVLGPTHYKTPPLL
jgi:hypothetical protein